MVSRTGDTSCMVKTGRRLAWRVITSLVLVVGVNACKRMASPSASEAGIVRAVQPPQFREGDYEAARAEARRRGVPLFVDVWASWCHSCMSMKEFVLRDPALGALAPAFVWLSIDSERKDSMPFLERFKSTSIPTLWVIDAQSERPLLKWIGAATVSELLTLLQETQRDAGRDTPSGGELAALWLRGNRASAQGDLDGAIDAYRSALSRSTAEWPTRPSVLEALSMRLSEAKRGAQCVQLAAREAASMPKGTPLVNVLVTAIAAGSELPANAPERRELPRLIALGTALVGDLELQVLVDDRSGLYQTLVDALASSDPAAAQRLAANWASLLEAHATAAASPAERRVWDPHRLEAYLALHQPERALPMLEQSERELPADFNAPARLARAQLALGHVALARAAIERALPRCSGPRKLRLYLLHADTLVAAGDRSAARASLQAALAFARDSQLPARYDAVRQQIERRLLELS